jgi:hypothetical protein
MFGTDDEEDMEKIITAEKWAQKWNKADIGKEDMNNLVMDVLVFEGFVEAARRFQEESNTMPKIDLNDATITDRITDRLAILGAIKSRDLADAIARVNALIPEIPEAELHLKTQKFIELMREEKIGDAVKFAQDEIAPIAENHEAFAKQFEKIFTLLTVYFRIPSTKELLGDSQWYRTYNEVNAAITGERGPQLQHLLNLLSVTQNKMDASGFEYPRLLLSTGHPL